MNNTLANPVMNPPSRSAMSNPKVTKGAVAEDVAVFDLFALFARRWSVLLVMTVLGAVLSLVYAYSVPPVYESTGAVLVIPKDTSIAAKGVQSPSMDSRAGNDWLATHMQIMQSQRVVEAALAKENLNALPSILKELKAGGSPTDYVLGRLSVVRGGEGSARDANILNVSFRHYDAKDAKAVLDAILVSYKEFMEATSRDAGSEAANLIRRATEELAGQVELNDKAYREFLASSPLLWTHGDTQNIHQIRVGELETAVTQMRIRKMSIESRYKTVSDALLPENRQAYSPQGMFALIDPNDIQRMSLLLEVEKGDPYSQAFQSQQPVRQAAATMDFNKLADLKSDVASMKQDLGEQHPKVLAKLEEIIVLERVLARSGDLRVTEDADDKLDLVALISAYQTQLENDLKGLTQQIAQMDAEIERETVLAKDMMQYVTRERELTEKRDQTKSLYNVVVARLGDISLLRDYSGFITEVIKDVSDGSQVWPKIPLMGVLGVMLGGISGCVLGLVIDLADKSFRNPSDLREHLQLPILAHIGSCVSTKTGVGNRELICLHEPTSPAAENIRRLRTALYFHAPGEKSKVIQVTSPLAGDGKTTLTANLAVSLAQAGKRVIVIDADMRRPRLHECFELPQDVGLSDVLISNTKLHNAIKSTTIPTLSVITSGTIPPNPSELLSMPTFSQMLESLHKEYEYVLIDTPPVLAVSDPIVVSSQVSGTILAIRLRKETREASLYAKESLLEANATLLGMVVNGLDAKSQKAFGYRDGYRYDAEYTVNYSSNIS